MKMLDTLYDVTKRVTEEKSDHIIMQELQKILIEALKCFHRFNAKAGRKEALMEAIEHVDDAKVILRLCVDMKLVTYEDFKVYEEKLQGLVRMMVAEKNIVFGSKKAVAERSLG